MKVALFGATGFVGSYIVDELLSQGHKPIVLVRKDSEKNRHRHTTAVLMKQQFSELL